MLPVHTLLLLIIVVVVAAVVIRAVVLIQKASRRHQQASAEVLRPELLRIEQRLTAIEAILNDVGTD